MSLWSARWRCVAVAAAALLAKEFALVSFNAIYARASGWPVGVIDLGLLGLIVLVTVAGLQTTGIIMVVALLIIPAAAARMWTDRLRWGLVLAGVFGAASGYFGAATSAVWAGLPAGAMVVLTAGGLFTLSVLFAPKRGVVATCVRHARSRGARSL
jgi:manganese/zinc/iron transport system permease protein